MDIFILIFLMLFVTYLPRVIPFYFVDTESIPPLLRRFLSFIPYAALGALIMPGSINAVSGRPVISLFAVCVAGVVAWFSRDIIASVFLSVAAVFIMLLIF
ncbi:MAG: AzlD domain-containing protein [Spirochaetota bacterium]